MTGLCANRNAEALLATGRKFPGSKLALSADRDVEGITYRGASSYSALIGETDADLVVNGISGAAGLMASVDALSSGKNLALANKESVVMGYSHLKSMAERNGRFIVPVDSEHAALFQLTSRIGSASVKELTITASGGPFRNKTQEELERMRPDEAAHHPSGRWAEK